MDLYSKTDYSISPFEKFIANEETRDSLYAEFTEIDEAHEIGARWIQFSNKCLDILDLLADLSRLLFVRFLDEYNKERAQIEADEERKSLIMSRMTSLLQLQVDASLLMNVYNEIKVNGIFGTQPSDTYSEHFIRAVKHLNEVKSLYFDDLPKEALAPISGLLKLQMQITDYEQLIPKMEKYLSEEYKEFIQQEKGKVSLLKAEFYGSVLGPMLVRIGDTWWWRDAISQYYVFDKSVSLYLKTIDIWSDVLTSELKTTIDQVKKTGALKAEAEKNFSLALHYRRLAREAAIKGDFKASEKYFNDSYSLLNNSLKELERAKDNPELNRLFKNVDYRIKHTKLMSGIANLSDGFVKVLEALKNNKKDDSLKLASELKDNAAKLSSIIEEDYISAIPMIFESIGEIAELLAKSPDMSNKEIEERLIRPFIQFRKRIEAKTDQFVSEWEDLVSPNPLETRVKFDNLENQLMYMTEAAALMPINTPGRNEIITRLKILRDTALSMISELDALAVSRENKVLELLLKAKAHHHAARAKKLAEQVEDKSKIPMNRIEAHYAGSFISGITAQMSVYILAIQYLTLNLVLRAFYNSMTIVTSVNKDNFNTILDQINRDFAALDGFMKMLSRIKGDCEILVKKKEELNQMSQIIQWEALEIRKGIVESIVLLTNSLKEVLTGQVYAAVKNFTEARIHYEEAKDMAYKASDILNKVFEPFGPNSSEGQLAQAVYAFWQFCFDNESRLSSNREPNPVPAQEFLQLMRGLIFRL